MSLALALGFFTETIAGVIYFMRGQTFAGLVSTSYGGFWLSYTLLVQLYGPQITADAPAITGMFLLAWAIFTMLTAGFCPAAFGSFAESTTWEKALLPAP